MTQIAIAVAIVALAMAGLALGLLAGRGPLKKRCALHEEMRSGGKPASCSSSPCEACGGEPLEEADESGEP